MEYCSYQITIFANLPPLASAAWCGPHPPHHPRYASACTMPPSYIWVRAVGVRLRTDRHTDTQTRVTTIHFASSTTHAKCNQCLINWSKRNWV